MRLLIPETTFAFHLLVLTGQCYTLVILIHKLKISQLHNLQYAKTNHQSAIAWLFWDIQLLVLKLALPPQKELLLVMIVIFLLLLQKLNKVILVALRYYSKIIAY